jgi:hypothetical protein
MTISTDDVKFMSALKSAHGALDQSFPNGFSGILLVQFPKSNTLKCRKPTQNKRR